jgi:hypothetical protein
VAGPCRFLPSSLAPWHSLSPSLPPKSARACGWSLCLSSLPNPLSLPPSHAAMLFWQDAGGVGREAGDDDALAQMEAEEDTCAEGANGKEVRGRLSEASALAEGLGARVRLDGDEEETAGSPDRSGGGTGADDMNSTPSRLPFTPGGRARAALSPIPQEEEEEAGSPGDGGEEEEDEAAAAGTEYLQPATSSTPGKEFHVRKTCLNRTAHILKSTKYSSSLVRLVLVRVELWSV